MPHVLSLSSTEVRTLQKHTFALSYIKPLHLCVQHAHMHKNRAYVVSIVRLPTD